MKPNDQVVINDVHTAVKRVAGTTPVTQEQLRQYIRGKLMDFLFQYQDYDVVVPGDLFDGFDVPADELFAVYVVFDAYLQCNPNTTLVLGAGNHDIGKRSDIMSGFSLLARLLQAKWFTRVIIAETETVYYNGTYIVPHFMNQDLFDLELERLLTDDVVPGIVLLHANVDNHFAEQADHSLNIMAPMLERLSKKHRLMFAHEHQARVVNYGGSDIIVMGNQWPTSISDCLAHGAAQKDGYKYAHILRQSGEIEKVETWSKSLEYVDTHWTELTTQPLEGGARFIRVTGNATASQASEVISVIAKFRTKSDALVIGNAVKIEGQPDMEEMAEISYEQITQFNVLEALLKLLTEREANVVKGLLENVPAIKS